MFDLQRSSPGIAFWYDLLKQRLCILLHPFLHIRAVPASPHRSFALSHLKANTLYYSFHVWDTSVLRLSPPHLSHYSFGALSKIILLFSEEFFTCKLHC